MGMELILHHGLKHFLNKFRRKGYRQDHYELQPEPPVRVLQRTEAGDMNEEIVLLLSEMIQAAGTYHGT